MNTRLTRSAGRRAARRSRSPPRAPRRKRRALADDTPQHSRSNLTHHRGAAPAHPHRDRLQSVSFRPIVEATGNVAFNGDHSTQVLSPVSGPATRVIGTPGMVVHARRAAGATCRRPTSRPRSPTIAKRRPAFRNAKRIADRDSALFKNDALARGELEQAQADLAAAEADVDAASRTCARSAWMKRRSRPCKRRQDDVDRRDRAAPIDGTIVEKLISDGQLLQAGTTPCFTIADLSTMWVLANVFANDLRDVVGRPARRRDHRRLTRADAGPRRLHRVAGRSGHQGRAGSRRRAEQQPPASPRHVRARADQESSAEHRGILVPVVVGAARRAEPAVRVRGRPGKGFARRRITLGTRVGDTYEVVLGARPAGDQVVADGALFLQFAETPVSEPTRPPREPLPST